MTSEPRRSQKTTSGSDDPSYFTFNLPPLAAAFFAGAFFAAAFFGAAFLATVLRAVVFGPAVRPRVVLSEMPSAVAFWRVAPSVRFSALAICEAGSLRAIDFSVLTSSDAQGRLEDWVFGALATSSP